MGNPGGGPPLGPGGGNGKPPGGGKGKPPGGGMGRPLGPGGKGGMGGMPRLLFPPGGAIVSRKGTSCQLMKRKDDNPRERRDLRGRP